MKTRVFVAVVGVAFWVASVGAGELEETFDKSYPLQAGQHFSLRNVNGRVYVYGWDRNEVRIRALKRVYGNSRKHAEQILDQIEIRVERDKDGIRVDTITPKIVSRGFLSWLFDGFGSHSLTVRYSIWLPNDVVAEIRTVNGAIYAEDLKGDLEFRSTNGKIRIENVAGRVSARTTNGSVLVELIRVDPDADIRVHTTNGSVKVFLPEDFAGTIEARTTNGAISTDFPVKVHGRISRRALVGTIGEGTARCKISTTNGSVKILKIDK